MKKSQRTVIGVTLLVGAILLGLILQFVGPGLITAASLPIPPPAPGNVAASSVIATTYHWPLFALLLTAIVGLLCLLLPRRHDHAA